MLCLLPEKIKEFRRVLKTRELDLNKLFDANTTTEQRIEVLKEFAGTNASDVVQLFESKFILKNKVLGIENAINKLGEMGRYDPAKKAKLDQALSEYKHKQQERVLNPKEEETFLKTLADKMLGTEVSKEEAQQLFELSSKGEKLLDENFNNGEWGSQQAAAQYGATKAIEKRYLENLRDENIPIKDMMRGYTQEVKDLWKEDKSKATVKVISDSTSTLVNNMINAVASWDNSFIGRQGAITLTKSPKTWWTMATKSMSDFYQTVKGNNPQDTLWAQVFADPDYINGNYKKAKLSMGLEEEVRGKLLERTPVLGRIFKASDVAFIDSAIRARIGLFKIMKQVYERTGNEMSDVTLSDMGKVINAITARGEVGRVMGSPIVNLVMWAPRMLKADWDVLTGHTLGTGLETNFARKEAAKTITGVVIATAGMAAIASAMGAQVETDPRSSDFMKMKIGNTRINIPFARGMPQLVTLFARLATQSTKSSSSGIIRKLNTGEYGSQTLFDVGLDFLTNKTTPPVGAVIAWLKGSDFKGDNPTLKNTAEGFLPISVQNFLGLKNDSSTQAVIGAFVDLFGVGSNTYSTSETDWTQNPGVELQAFQTKVGDENFKKANDTYNTQYDTWLKSVRQNPQFIDLSSEDKQRLITKKKGEIKDSIFRTYGFRYKSQKASPLPKL